MSQPCVGPGRRNPGTPLDLAWVRSLRPTAGGPVPMPRGADTATLAGIVRCLDLTTLAGDDTPAHVRRLCALARRPLPARAARVAGIAPEANRVAAVCVYPVFVPTAVEALAGSGIPVAAACGGFPHGLSPLATRTAEVEYAIAAGAGEIDAVIARMHALLGDWTALYDEVRALRDAAGDAGLKVILSTGELRSRTTIARATAVCLMAGADFVKTSTGKEAVNATVPAGRVMARVLREYRRRTGVAAGLKPAGGIRSVAQALGWHALAAHELGPDGTGPERFRIGASGLLAVLRRRIVAGRRGASGGTRR